MKKLMMVFSIVVSFTPVFFFQNCSSGAVDPAVATPTPQGSNTDNWRSGDNFVYANVPQTYRSQMVETTLAALNYSSYPYSKAVAITANGLGFARLGAAGSAQSEINTRALETCFAISGGQPCALLASGSTFAVSRSDLPNSFTFRLSAPAAMANIPFMSSTTASQVANLYLAAATPKALAIGMDGTYFYTSNSASTPIANTAEASRVALERCELSATITPCTLFAIDNNFTVFSAAFFNRTPSIDYSRTALATNIPGIRDAVFAQAIQNDYLSRVNGTTVFGAIYVTSAGTLGYAYGADATAADNNARTQCVNNNASGNTNFPCFRYASSRLLSPMASNLAAIRTMGMDFHCKAIPRSSCAAHRQMGCITGQFYTGNFGSVSLENCM